MQSLRHGYAKCVCICALNIRNMEPNAVKMMIGQSRLAETAELNTTVLNAFLLLVFSSNPIQIITFIS